MAGLVAAWPFIKRFWWIAPLVVLAFICLGQRATISGKSEELAKANGQVAELTKANKFNAEVIQSMAQARIDNDAIATAVAAKLNTNQVREVNTRTIIERAVRNDPTVRDWGAVPVPSSVREALRAGSVQPGTP